MQVRAFVAALVVLLLLLVAFWLVTVACGSGTGSCWAASDELAWLKLANST